LRAWDKLEKKYSPCGRVSKETHVNVVWWA
jgi:hypothetical protein